LFNSLTRNASFVEMAVVAKDELADDKAAEEKPLRAEFGMVRPADEDPDLKGDQMTSSAMPDRVGGRLQQLVLWNRVCMGHINVNAEWCIVNAPDSESLILIRPTLVDAHVIEVEMFRRFFDIA
jgi:hypothetical protein